MVDAQVARDGRGIDMKRAGVRNVVVVGAVVLVGTAGRGDGERRFGTRTAWR